MTNVVTDHLGNAFPTIKDMCEYYHITTTIYYGRKRKNKWSLEQILTMPIKEIKAPIPNDIPYEDHLGQTFPNLQEMCKHWNIPLRTYKDRKRRNWSIEKILTTPIIRKEKESIDHLGNKFPSKSAMCKHWNIDFSTYTYRVEKYGWSKEKALTTKPDVQEVIPIDPYGNIFESIKDMCKTYEINLSTYDMRMRKQKSNIEIFGIIPVLSHTIQNYKFNEHLTILEAINHTHKSGPYTPKYFTCIFDGQEVMLPYTWIIQYCEQHLPPEKNPMRNHA